MNSEVKKIFLSHARELPKKQFFELYKGVLPKATMYKWYNEIDFDDEYYVRYTPAVLVSEWKKVKQTNRGYIASPVTNKIILHYQQHFYETERRLLKDPQIKHKLLLNRKKYLQKDVDNISVRELLLGFKISGIYRGYSHFSPYWIKQFLIEHNSQQVYDPTGGWGHRLIGACSLPNVHYYYNDFWKKSVDGVNAIKKIFNITNCTIYNNRSESFVPDFDYDTVFTCPPYYNKENYNDTSFKSQEDFLNWWSQTVHCFTNPRVNVIGICIDIENIDNIAKPILNYGFTLKDNRPLGPKRKMHYLKTNNDTRDRLLTFLRSC